MAAARRTGRSRINSTAAQEAQPRPDWQKLTKEFLEHKERRGLSPDTLVYYRYRMQSWLNFIEEERRTETPEQVTADTVVDWSYWVRSSRHCSANTARHGMIALRAFYNWYLKRTQAGFRNPVSDAEKPVVLQKVIETFSPEQLTAMIADCDSYPDFYGIRDKAAILLLLDTGLPESPAAGSIAHLRLREPLRRTPR